MVFLTSLLLSSLSFMVSPTEQRSHHQEDDVITECVRPGVLTGRRTLERLEEYLRKRNRRLPMVYCTCPSDCIKALEGALRDHDSNDDPFPPIIIVRCNFKSSLKYIAGRCSNNDGHSVMRGDEHRRASAVEGAIALGRHLHEISQNYGVAVILQSETRCWEQLTMWFDSGVLQACEESYRSNGVPLFSSHLVELPVDVVPNSEELAAIYHLYRQRLETIDMKLNTIE